MLNNKIDLVIVFVSALLLYLAFTQSLIILTFDRGNLIGILSSSGSNPQSLAPEDMGLLLQAFSSTIEQMMGINIENISFRQSYSMISGVKELYLQKNYLPATVILIFSILFPVLKIVCLTWVSLKPQSGGRKIANLFVVINRWSMIDVFVVAIIVILSSKAIYFNAKIDIGFFYFMGYFLLMSYSSHRLARSG